MNVDINVLLSVSSFILSIVAIWQSWQYYSKSKESEKNTALALESIKTQSQMLERLTGRWMDKLIKHSTSPQQADEMTLKMFEFVQTTQLRLPDVNEDARNAELISSYIAIFYYCGIANLTSQGQLPSLEDSEDNAVKNVVDTSYNDYNSMAGVLEKIDSTRVEKSGLYHLYVQAVGFKEYVKDSLAVYRERATAQEASQEV